MSTERLYYTDAYRTSFETRVLRCWPHGAASSPAAFAVELESTAFYPTSGGQPFDVGSLGEARVLDVIDEDGRMTHVVDRALAEGAAVRGTIDWTRRELVFEDY